MTNYSLHEIYKDLYYHELEVREKITNRLQLSFAFHATAISVLAYILRMIDYESPFLLLAIVYASLVLFVVLLSKSIYETVKAFWGNTYKALASAEEIENYRKSCLEHENYIKKYQKQYPDQKIDEYCAEEKINTFLYSEFSNCAAHNSSINDTRSARIHEATKYLLLSLIPFLFAAFFFTTFDMDSSSPRKRFLIEYSGITESLDKIPEKVGSEVYSSLSQSNEELIHAANSLSDSVNKLLEVVPITKKESAMSDDENNSPVSQDSPAPPTPPEPPEPRNIIESQDPEIMVENEG